MVHICFDKENAMTLRNKIAVITAGLLFAFAFYKGCQMGRHSYLPQVSNVIPKDDKEQITVNPVNHTLTIRRPGQKDQTLTLPDRVSTVDITKANMVKVTSKQYGLELHPFIAITMADSIRVGLGLDTLYYKRLDFGVGAASEPGQHPPVVFAKLSYNIWSNTQIGISIDNHKNVGASFSVRL
jgi:hypothetical protein